MNHIKPTPNPWPWVAYFIFSMLALFAGVQVLDQQAAAQAQHIAEKKAAQKKARQEQQHATKLDRAAAAVCRDSHGPDAVHWWDDSGVLVCAATRAAMDAATTAVQIARSAQGTQHASTGTGGLR